MPPSLSVGLMWYAVFVFSTVCHEAAHAWTAFRLGDDTAQRGGQASLNPWPHIRREPLGMVVVPLVSWFAGGWLFGWASAPYNPQWARRYPRRAAWMALAGPAANLSLVLLAALLIRVGIEWRVFVPPDYLGRMSIAQAASPGAWDFTAKLLSVFFSLNLLLCLFNLVPVPPLDGSNLPLLVLPTAAAEKYRALLSSPMLRTIGLLLILNSFSRYFSPILLTVAGWLYPGAHYRPA